MGGKRGEDEGGKGYVEGEGGARTISRLHAHIDRRCGRCASPAGKAGQKLHLDSGGKNGRPVSFGTIHEDHKVYGNFDMIVRHFSRIPQCFANPTHAVCCALLGVHPHRMPVGACNPMVCPIRGFRYRSRC